MYLVGDRINLPSPLGGDVNGTISIIEEQIDGGLAYVINTDDGQIAIRYSEDDHEISFINNIEVDFN